MKNIKLQYYLRGLGVGILVTAVIMGAVLPREEQKLTDAEIRKMAAELGMVDQDSLVLSDLQGDQLVKVDSVDSEETDSEIETVSTEETNPEIETVSTEETVPQETEVAQTEEITTEEIITEEISTEEVPTEEMETESTQSEEAETEEQEIVSQSLQSRVTGVVNEDGVTVTIEIHSGANSYSVSKVLADTGLVASAKSYDNYLCNGGYSKKIHTGNYTITIGTGEEEIAKIITGNR